MLISTGSELVEGALRGGILVSTKEPLEEEMFISDEGIEFMFFNIE
jgi:hypothetical protein